MKKKTNEELNPPVLKKLATDLAYSMPNHTSYDGDKGPSDAQIIKAFKYFPDLKQYATAKQKKEVVSFVKKFLSESINEAYKLNKNVYRDLDELVITEFDTIQFKKEGNNYFVRVVTTSDHVDEKALEKLGFRGKSSTRYAGQYNYYKDGNWGLLKLNDTQFKKLISLVDKGFKAQGKSWHDFYKDRVADGVIREAKSKWPSKFTLSKNVRVADNQYTKGEYFFKQERMGKALYQQGYNSVNSFSQSDIEKFKKDGILTEAKKPKRTNRWLELKNDDSMHGHKKLAVGLKELKYQLREVEKFLGWYNKLKNINELDSDNYWKRTNNNIYKIKERLVNIVKKIQEIEK